MAVAKAFAWCAQSSSADYLAAATPPRHLSSTVGSPPDPLSSWRDPPFPGVTPPDQAELPAA